MRLFSIRGTRRYLLEMSFSPDEFCRIEDPSAHEHDGSATFLERNGELQVSKLLERESLSAQDVLEELKKQAGSRELSSFTCRIQNSDYKADQVHELLLGLNCQYLIFQAYRSQFGALAKLRSPATQLFIEAQDRGFDESSGLNLFELSQSFRALKTLILLNCHEFKDKANFQGDLELLVVINGKLPPLPRRLKKLIFRGRILFPEDHSRASKCRVEELVTFRCRANEDKFLKILRSLQNLRRLFLYSPDISYRSTVDSPELPLILSRLTQLEKLRFSFEFLPSDRSHLEGIFKNLPPSLKELGLFRYGYTDKIYYGYIGRGQDRSVKNFGQLFSDLSLIFDYIKLLEKLDILFIRRDFNSDFNFGLERPSEQVKNTLTILGKEVELDGYRDVSNYLMDMLKVLAYKNIPLRLIGLILEFVMPTSERLCGEEEDTGFDTYRGSDLYA